MFLLIDIDDFKKINEYYGHTIGDKALSALSKCLKDSFSEDDVVMRFGGDEFAVFVQNIENEKYGKELIGAGDPG